MHKSETAYWTRPAQEDKIFYTRNDIIKKLDVPIVCCWYTWTIFIQRSSLKALYTAICSFFELFLDIYKKYFYTFSLKLQHVLLISPLIDFVLILRMKLYICHRCPSQLLWVLAMVPYASLCIEGLTSKMVSLGLRHSKKFTLPFWFMVVWPPLWLKNTESEFFSKYAK